MVKLVRKQMISEAKQVGSLYHVCSLDALANYIAPTDTLKGSGKYKNWMLGGRNDVVSFTRNKRFVVKTEGIKESIVLFNFKCDGDKLSEKYKVIPYNDFAYDVDTGEKDLKNALYDYKSLESEEVVVGSITKFSTYVESVRFNAVLRNFDDIHSVRNLLEKCVAYLNQFTITFDPNLIVKETLNDLLYAKIPFSSFTEFVDFVFTLDDFISGKKVDDRKVKKYLKLIREDLLDSYLRSYTEYHRYPDTRVIQMLLDVGADPKEIDYSHLSKEGLLQFGKYLSDKDKIKYIMPFVTMDMLNLDSSLFIDPHFTKDFFKEMRGEDLCRMLRAIGVLNEDDLDDILIGLYNN